MNPKFKYVRKQVVIKLIKQFSTDFPERKLVGLVQVGSHLFDLHTEESDLDFKGIYIPSKEEVMKGESRRREISYNTNSKTKNSKEDIDCTFLSITKLFDLLSSGEFNCLELINAPDDRIIVDSEIFQEIRHFKSAFTVVNVSSFLGFIKREFRKYGLGKSQLGLINKFLVFLDGKTDSLRLKDLWPDICKLEGVELTVSDTGTGVEIPTVRIGQRLFQWTTRVMYVRSELLKIVKDKVNSHRKDDSGIDVKGLYHCQRLLFEAKSLLTTGEIKIPFPEDEHAYLSKIRNKKIKVKEMKLRIESDILKVKALEQLHSITSSNFIDNYHNNLIARLKISYLMV